MPFRKGALTIRIVTPGGSAKLIPFTAEQTPRAEGLLGAFAAAGGTVVG